MARILDIEIVCFDTASVGWSGLGDESGADSNLVLPHLIEWLSGRAIGLVCVGTQSHFRFLLNCNGNRPLTFSDLLISSGPKTFQPQ